MLSECHQKYKMSQYNLKVKCTEKWPKCTAHHHIALLQFRVPSFFLSLLLDLLCNSIILFLHYFLDIIKIFQFHLTNKYKIRITR
jgi:hypothetical protein